MKANALKSTTRYRPESAIEQDREPVLGRPVICFGCRSEVNTTTYRCKKCKRPCHQRCTCICERAPSQDKPLASKESLLRSVQPLPGGMVPPMPKTSVCETMCAKCPFRPSGKGYAADHPDFDQIKGSVEMGLPFYCHETVLFDSRTKLTEGPLGVEADGIQPHFAGCRGAHEHRMVDWKSRVLDMLAQKAKKAAGR